MHILTKYKDAVIEEIYTSWDSLFHYSYRLELYCHRKSPATVTSHSSISLLISPSRCKISFRRHSTFSLWWCAISLAVVILIVFMLMLSFSVYRSFFFPSKSLASVIMIAASYNRSLQAVKCSFVIHLLTI